MLRRNVVAKDMGRFVRSGISRKSYEINETPTRCHIRPHRLS